MTRDYAAELGGVAPDSINSSRKGTALPHIGRHSRDVLLTACGCHCCSLLAARLGLSFTFAFAFFATVLTLPTWLGRRSVLAFLF